MDDLGDAGGKLGAISRFLMEMVKDAKLRNVLTAPLQMKQSIDTPGHSQDDQWTGKGTWRLNVILLTLEYVEELKRDYTDLRTVKPFFESPADRRCTGRALISSLKEEDGLVIPSHSDILRITDSFNARLSDYLKMLCIWCKELILINCCRQSHFKIEHYVLSDVLKFGTAVAKEHW
eukprot:g43969.t1